MFARADCLMSRAGSTASGHPMSVSGGEMLSACVVAVYAALTVAVWAAGQLAAWIRTGHWLPMSVGAGAEVVMRLPTHLADPTVAWPSTFRAALPSGPVVLACLVASLGALAGLAAAAIVAWRRISGARTPGAIGRGAAWATSQQLKPILLSRLSRRGEAGDDHSSGARAGRVVLGRLAGSGGAWSGGAGSRLRPRRARLVATEARHSVLVFGPTQSGKTTGLAIPAILEWQGPVMATSVKADLVRDTLAWRRRQGRTWIYDPTASTGLVAATWSPLAGARDWAGAQRLAHWLTTASAPRAGLSDAEFWLAAASKLLAPLLHACALSGRDMADLVRWLDTIEQAEVTAALVVASAEEALVAFEASCRRDERQLSSIYTTAEMALAAFADRNVVASAHSSDIEPAALLEGNHTLYLCGTVHEQGRLQGVFASLIQAVIEAAVYRASVTGRPLDPPLLLVLDEAANIAPLRELDTLASTAAGMGIQLVTICQDVAQLATRYGPDRARTIANNHRAKVVLSGVSDPTTLELMSGLLGEEAYQQQSISAESHERRRTFTSSVAYRRLASTDELRRIRPGQGVLVYGHLPAARLELRPWYGDATLRRRTEPAD
jgi:type IV secretion system protein VirD4